MKPLARFGILVGIILTLAVCALRVHTGFLSAQIRDEESLPMGISSMTELVGYLSARRLDWNSCELEDDLILDGWGQIVRFTDMDGGFGLHSRGVDGIFDTDDDIVMEIGQRAPELIVGQKRILRCVTYVIQFDHDSICCHSCSNRSRNQRAY